MLSESAIVAGRDSNEVSLKIQRAMQTRDTYHLQFLIPVCLLESTNKKSTIANTRCVRSINAQEILTENLVL